MSVNKSKKDLDKLVAVMLSTKRLVWQQNKDKFNPFNFIHLEVLHFITQKKDPKMKEVADYLGITPPSATSLVNYLARTKQLKRVSDKKDRRIVRLMVTDKGKKNMEKGFNEAIARSKKILGKLNKKDVKDFIRIYEKLIRLYKK